MKMNALLVALACVPSASLVPLSIPSRRLSRVAGGDDDWLLAGMDEAKESPAVIEYEAPAPRAPRRDFSNGDDRRTEYMRDPDDDGSAVDEGAVNALLAERSQCKRARDFDSADAIRDELKAVHGVSVWDKDLMWRTGRSGGGRGGDPRGGRGGGGRGGGRKDLGPRGHDYEREGGASASGMAEAEVDALLAERLRAKFARDFGAADAIQEDLFERGVRVHDGMKVWRDDGEGFGDERRSDGRPGRTVGSRSFNDEPYGMSLESGAVDDEAAAAIAALVAERLQAKRDRAFDVADAIREQLKDAYDVYVDDRSREWAVGKPSHGHAGGDRDRPYARRGAGDLSEADVAAIQGSIDERCEAKVDRDFEKADAIRDDLKNKHAIVIDDRSREWRVQTDSYAAGDRSAAVSAETKAAIDALVVERSARKRDRDYDAADAIRDQLKADYAVTLDDRVREYTVTAAPAPASAVALEEASVAAAGGAFVVLDDAAAAPENAGGSDSLYGPPGGAAPAAAEAAAAPTAAPAAGGGQSAEDLAELTVPALKDICRDGGLKVGGKKADLIDRILEARA